MRRRARRRGTRVRSSGSPYPRRTRTARSHLAGARARRRGAAPRRAGRDESVQLPCIAVSRYERRRTTSGRPRRDPCAFRHDSRHSACGTRAAASSVAARPLRQVDEEREHDEQEQRERAERDDPARVTRPAQLRDRDPRPEHDEERRPRRAPRRSPVRARPRARAASRTRAPSPRTRATADERRDGQPAGGHAPEASRQGTRPQFAAERSAASRARSESSVSPRPRTRARPARAAPSLGGAGARARARADDRRADEHGEAIRPRRSGSRRRRVSCS